MEAHSRARESSLGRRRYAPVELREQQRHARAAQVKAALAQRHARVVELARAKGLALLLAKKDYI